MTVLTWPARLKNDRLVRLITVALSVVALNVMISSFLSVSSYVTVTLTLPGKPSSPYGLTYVRINASFSIRESHNLWKIIIGRIFTVFQIMGTLYLSRIWTRTLATTQIRLKVILHPYHITLCTSLQRYQIRSKSGIKFAKGLLNNVYLHLFKDSYCWSQETTHDIFSIS